MESSEKRSLRTTVENIGKNAKKFVDRLVHNPSTLTLALVLLLAGVSLTQSQASREGIKGMVEKSASKYPPKEDSNNYPHYHLPIPLETIPFGWNEIERVDTDDQTLVIAPNSEVVVVNNNDTLPSGMLAIYKNDCRHTVEIVNIDGLKNVIPAACGYITKDGTPIPGLDVPELNPDPETADDLMGVIEYYQQTALCAAIGHANLVSLCPQD